MIRIEGGFVVNPPPPPSYNKNMKDPRGGAV